MQTRASLMISRRFGQSPGQTTGSSLVHGWSSTAVDISRPTGKKNWTTELGCKGQGSEAAIALGESHKLPDFVRLGTTEIKSAREA